MRFAVYLPPAARHGPVPVLYFLAGLTCTEETATIKAGAQAHAARLGLALVMPDTSPRGASIEGEDDDWDFGTGAGFYLNRPPSRRGPRTTGCTPGSPGELRALVASRFPVKGTTRPGVIRSLDGRPRRPDHRAEGPGRLAPRQSAFAPICAPSQCRGARRRSAATWATTGPRGWNTTRPPSSAPSEVLTDPRRPGRGRPVPGVPASPPSPGGGLNRDRPAARAPPPPGLRPQLLVHPHVRRRPPGTTTRGAWPADPSEAGAPQIRPPVPRPGHGLANATNRDRSSATAAHRTETRERDRTRSRAWSTIGTG